MGIITVGLSPEQNIGQFVLKYFNHIANKLKHMPRSLKATLFLIAGTILFFSWFIPSMDAILEGKIEQTRWLRYSSETSVMVGPKTENWTPYGDISKHFIHAIISAEDAHFFAHKGLDFTAIWNSFLLNLKKGKYVRGASTITQQVVKLGVLSNRKTLIRKSREAIGAIMLERKLSKNQIMAWYANLADFGSGVYGIKDAAKYYFNTTPAKLTVAESIHLALVLPAPNAWSEGLKKKLLTEFGRRRFTRLLEELRNNGYITPNQFETTMQTGNFGRPISSVVHD